jgi:ribosomal protein S18 acetylase RimI-like enzyme
MIRKMLIKDIEECAYLHYVSIKDSFLCEFGTPFFQRLYKRLIESDKCFGYVDIDNSKIVGFIAGSENMDGFMKSLFLKDFFVIVPIVLRRLIARPHLFKNIIQTLSYSKKSNVDDIKAELVSIVVRQDFRGKKLGTFLLNDLINHFKENGITKFKVMVDKNNPTANAFYKASGFKLRFTFNMYNKDVNLYIYE